MDSYLDLLSSMIFTDRDIIELQNPFNVRQYNGEIIVVVRDHTDFQLSILIRDFTEHHRCNNIVLILTISSDFIIETTDKIEYQNRFDFLNELRTPKEAFEDVQESASRDRQGQSPIRNGSQSDSKQANTKSNRMERCWNEIDLSIAQDS
jgi:hypothetical protein